MLSIIDHLAKTIPSLEQEWTDYRATSVGARDAGSVQALFLAEYVCQYLTTGRVGELQPFFDALETAYQSPGSEDDSVALYEGFMEDFIHDVGRLQIPPEQVYGQLGSTTRSVWEQAWQYVRRAPWKGADA